MEKINVELEAEKSAQWMDEKYSDIEKRLYKLGFSAGVNKGMQVANDIIIVPIANVLAT